MEFTVRGYRRNGTFWKYYRSFRYCFKCSKANLNFKFKHFIRICKVSGDVQSLRKFIHNFNTFMSESDVLQFIPDDFIFLCFEI